jgi:hypothetical protein
VAVNAPKQNIESDGDENAIVSVVPEKDGLEDIEELPGGLG